MFKVLSLTLCMSLALTFSAFAQATPTEKSEPQYRDYDVTQYISTRGYGPTSIIRLDNNGELVLACRGGKTRDQLKAAGIDYRISQLILLESYRIIERTGDTVKTLLPFLNEEQTARLRERTRLLAAGIVPVIRDDIVSFRDYMDSVQLLRNTYSIVFSLSLDGLIWDMFRERGLVASTAITADTPFWNGVVWGVYPPRTFSPGTNSRSNGKMMLGVNWSDDSWSLIRPFWSQPEYFDSLFNDYLDDGIISSEATREAFAPYGVIDGNGNITVPVVVESPDDPIYSRCYAFTEKIADAFLSQTNLDSIVTAYSLAGRNEAVIIVYHDLMWDILDLLEADGLIERPLAFAKPDQATPESIADLVYIIAAP